VSILTRLQVDDKTLAISTYYSDNFSLAFLWRETPVKRLVPVPDCIPRYLGLPVYGVDPHSWHTSLPSPPWKKFCAQTSCN
jgi:hypothetical protein